VTGKVSRHRGASLDEVEVAPVGRRCPKCRQRIRKKSEAESHWLIACVALAPLIREIVLLLRELI
jgi:hypothetical protein